MRLIALPLAAALVVGGCSVHAGEDDAPGIAPSGTGTQRSYAADGFTKIELAGADQVEVRVGPAFSVRAQGPADVLDRLRIETEGDTLEIGRKRNTSGSGVARILVTLPRLAGTSLAGSGTMTVDRVEGGTLEAEVAGSGTLRFAALAVDGLEADIAGSGTLAAAGTAGRLDLDIAGSGSVDARGLTARGADVSIAGSGNVRATVNGDAEVEIMGSGDVDLGQGARCKVEKMGSGNVRCGG